MRTANPSRDSPWKREKENILLSSVQGRFHLFFPSPLQASLWPPPLSLSLPAIDRQIFGGNCEEEAVVYIFRPVALVEITAALAPGGLSPSLSLATAAPPSLRSQTLPNVLTYLLLPPSIICEGSPPRMVVVVVISAPGENSRKFFLEKSFLKG